MTVKRKPKVSVGIKTTAVGKKMFRCEIGLLPVGRIQIEGRSEWLNEGAGHALGELFRTLCFAAEKFDPDGYKVGREKLMEAWERATDQFAKGEKNALVTA